MSFSMESILSKRGSSHPTKDFTPENRLEDHRFQIPSISKTAVFNRDFHPSLPHMTPAIGMYPPPNIGSLAQSAVNMSTFSPPVIPPMSHPFPPHWMMGMELLNHSLNSADSPLAGRLTFPPFITLFQNGSTHQTT